KGLAPIGKTTAINQIVYDPATNTAYAKPDEFFDQHRHYALIVTDAVHDASGRPVKPDPRFTACIQSPANDYCDRVAKVASSAASSRHSNSVSASIFTTLSATTWLEKARDLLPQVPPDFHSLGAPVKAAGITAINVRDRVGGTRVITVPTVAGTLNGVDRI